MCKFWLIFFLTSVAVANPLFFGNNSRTSGGGGGGGGGGASITSSGTWTGAGITSNISSIQRTLTVPAGNPGNIKLSISTDAASMKYNKNSTGLTAFTTDTIINVSSGDTLLFQMLGSSSGKTMDGSVIDNTTGATVATVSIVNTS